MLTLSRETTRPGFSGAQFAAGRQRIARSSVLFAGAAIRYSRVDRPLNPRQGFDLETRYERGNKERTTLAVGEAGDTLRVLEFARQERLLMRGRLFVPIFARQVLALGNDLSALISDAFDESDLFRMGGATTLRGYEEDRFRGRFVNRAFAEFRYQFERASFAYAFFDLGIVDRPQTPEAPAEKGLYPGYGFGFQFESGVGLINTSFALGAGDSPADAKVHVGLSVGL